MGGYEVNIAELAKLIQTLQDGAEEVRDANKTLAATGQLDMLGNDRLCGEGHEFEEKWQYGLEKLDEAADAVVERLEKAKKAYEELEHDIGGLLGKFKPEGNEPEVGGYTGGLQDVLGGGS